MRGTANDHFYLVALSVKPICWTSRELQRTATCDSQCKLFGLEIAVQLIVFLTDIKNTLKRKIYGSHKQKC